eukprot:TRINITY_DN12831_c0_g1_i7.p1 TRINITY_DN12831_c0_g1~~TRINITY_DN12831_c0_g1_i7.p1  ORF type:complete len:125 (-),score=10.34 TRINITY_DN12831_c0_g1_i7:154-528(-)
MLGHAPNDADQIIVQVKAGAFHSAALSSTGSLYMWGHNGYGQLGVDDVQDRLSPTQVPLPVSIAVIECGSWHSLALPGMPAEHQARMASLLELCGKSKNGSSSEKIQAAKSAGFIALITRLLGH